MEDIGLIGINPPDIQPFATDFIEEMILSDSKTYRFK